MQYNKLQNTKLKLNTKNTSNGYMTQPQRTMEYIVPADILPNPVVMFENKIGLRLFTIPVGMAI